MTDEQREAAIVQAGANMQRAYAAGDRPAAQAYLRTMEDLIKGRSAGQVTRMEAALGLGSCYFDNRGARDRLKLVAKAVQPHA